MRIDLQELKESVEQELVRIEQRRQALENQRDHIEAVQRYVSGLNNSAEAEKVEATLLAGPGSAPRRKHWFRG